MWTKRDWACFGVSALAVFGVTMASAWPRGATADDGNRLTVPAGVKPMLLANGVSITARISDNQKTLGTSGPVMLIKSGEAPKMQVVLTNTLTSRATVRLDASVNSTSINAAAMISRVPMGSPATPIWTQPIAVSLSGGETQVVSLDVDTAVTPMTMQTLKLQAGEVKIDALVVAAAATPAPTLAKP